MAIFDIVLIVILAGFILNGLFKGLIRLLGHVVSLILGSYIATHYYLLVFEWGKDFAHGYDNIAKVVAFIILYIVATRLITFLFILLEKVFKIIAFIPLTKYINNLLGAALGLIEGSLFLGLILYVASRYAIIGSLFGDQLVNSVVTPFLLKFIDIILPVLPATLTALKSII